MDGVLQRRDELRRADGIDGRNAYISGGEVGELGLREQRRVVGYPAYELRLALDHLSGAPLGEQ